MAYFRKSNSSSTCSYIPVTEENCPHLYVEDHDGIRVLNEEEKSRYYRAVKESEGFDVPAFPKRDAVGMIMPIPDLKLYDEKLGVVVEEAIEYYNKKNKTNLEVVKIVNANQQAVRGIMYYVTFEVKERGRPDGYPTTTFQAKVLHGVPPEREVQICRPKPSN